MGEAVHGSPCKVSGPSPTWARKEDTEIPNGTHRGMGTATGGMGAPTVWGMMRRGTHSGDDEEEGHPHWGGRMRRGTHRGMRGSHAPPSPVTLAAADGTDSAVLRDSVKLI